MLATGMVRKIDGLGRIVIPKEIRRSLKIENGDDVEMFSEDDRLILKKYEIMDKYLSLAKSYCGTIYDNIHTNCFICGKERVAATSLGDNSAPVSRELSAIMANGGAVLLQSGRENGTVTLYEGDEPLKYMSQYIAPVKCMGDLYGAIVAYSNKNIDFFKDFEISLIKSASLLLCGQLS